jgi:hypothetical protein
MRMVLAMANKIAGGAWARGSHLRINAGLASLPNCCFAQALAVGHNGMMCVVRCAGPEPSKDSDKSERRRSRSRDRDRSRRESKRSRSGYVTRPPSPSPTLFVRGGADPPLLVRRAAARGTGGDGGPDHGLSRGGRGHAQGTYIHIWPCMELGCITVCGVEVAQ